MTNFSRLLKKYGVKKIDSAAYSGKLTLRRMVLEAIENPRVFDAFSGSGGMYRDVWQDAEGYTGCDKRYFPDGRLAFVADNRRVMRAIDLSGFNLFDLDAYGSPWEQALILAARRPVKQGERIGLCITEGSGLNIKMGGLSLAHQVLLGIKKPPAGLIRRQDVVIDRCVHALSRRMGCRLVSYWKMKGKKGSSLRYLGLILEGTSDAEVSGADSDSRREDISANPS